jgi:hypothetical protein
VQSERKVAITFRSLKNVASLIDFASFDEIKLRGKKSVLIQLSSIAKMSVIFSANLNLFFSLTFVKFPFSPLNSN